MRLLLLPGETLGICVPDGKVSLKLRSIFFPPGALNFEEILIVVTKQGGTAEAAIDGVNEMIDSIANTA